MMMPLPRAREMGQNKHKKADAVPLLLPVPTKPLDLTETEQWIEDLQRQIALERLQDTLKKKSLG